MTLLPDAQSLIAFLVASLVLAVTPGAGVAYIVTRSVTHGRRSGMASVCGVAAGNWCNAIGASIGLAAVFAMSSAAFTIVKLAGAAYLVYLGMQILRGPSTEDGVTPIEPVPVAMVFRDGFIVALLNPKNSAFLRGVSATVHDRWVSCHFSNRSCSEHCSSALLPLQTRCMR